MINPTVVSVCAFVALVLSLLGLFFLLRRQGQDLLGVLRDLSPAIEGRVMTDQIWPRLVGSYGQKPVTFRLAQMTSDGAWSLAIRMRCACPFTLVLVNRRIASRLGYTGTWGVTRPLDLGVPSVDRHYRVGPSGPSTGARSFLLEPPVTAALQRLVGFSWIVLDEGFIEVVLHNVSPHRVRIGSEELLDALDQLAACAGRLEAQRPEGLLQ